MSFNCTFADFKAIFSGCYWSDPTRMSDKRKNKKLVNDTNDPKFESDYDSKVPSNQSQIEGEKSKKNKKKKIKKKKKKSELKRIKKELKKEKKKANLMRLELQKEKSKRIMVEQLYNSMSITPDDINTKHIEQNSTDASDYIKKNNEINNINNIDNISMNNISMNNISENKEINDTNNDCDNIGDIRVNRIGIMNRQKSNLLALKASNILIDIGMGLKDNNEQHSDYDEHDINISNINNLYKSRNHSLPSISTAMFVNGFHVLEPTKYSNRSPIKSEGTVNIKDSVPCTSPINTVLKHFKSEDTVLSHNNNPYTYKIMNPPLSIANDKEVY